MNKNDFDIIELLMICFPILLLITIICCAIQEENKTCLEYEEIPVTTCYQAGGGLICEYNNKRQCVRYE